MSSTNTTLNFVDYIVIFLIADLSASLLIAMFIPGAPIMTILGLLGVMVVSWFSYEHIRVHGFRDDDD